MTLGTLRIVATYSVFSHTADEPAHIAAGMEWLDQGKYRYEPLHPPLARIATALGPYLDGRVSQHLPDMWPEGLAILGQGADYDRTLTLARLGILPFFWLACLVVYVWGRHYFGEPVACTAVLIFSMLPSILAHAGLATTDMPLTATVSAAFLLAALWAEKPTPGRSLGLGLATGLAV
ncbi:MAG: ArnT family glycosyltransferase, partial [Nevskiales bacterium]